MRKKLTALLLSCLLVTACADTAPETNGPFLKGTRDLAAAAKAPTGAMPDKTFVTAVTDFSENLFRRCAQPGKNLILSPLSAVCALTLTANGAHGETLREFNTLNGGIGVSEMNEYLFQYALRLASAGESKAEISNSVWADDAFEINPQFRWIAEQYYNAGAVNADFQADGTADRINQWLSDKTDGIIPQVLDSIPEDAVMMILNTVLFDGVWQDPYHPDYAVKNGTFRNYSGTESDAVMLYSYELTYFDENGYAGFSKAYTDDFRFLALLPDEGTDVYEFAASLDWTDAIDTALNGSLGRADCYIPKFEYDAELPLTEILGDMGLTKAFTPEAELTGLTAGESAGLRISTVRQKAKITLNETGTKAAAYTVVCIEECEYPSIRFDRPFVYAVIDSGTGIPLFMGIMAELP